MEDYFVSWRHEALVVVNVYSIVIVILLSLYCHIVLIPNHSAADSTHPDPGQLIDECLKNE